MIKYLRLLTLSLVLPLGLPLGLVTAPAAAQSLDLLVPGGKRPLDPDQAFRVETTWTESGALDVDVEIAPGYYLYRDRLTVSPAGPGVRIDSAAGEPKDDPNFGRVEVWHDQAMATIHGLAGEVTLSWQGCQEDGICYPPQSRSLTAPTPVSASAGGSSALNAPTTPAAPVSTLQIAAPTGPVEELLRAGGLVWVVLGFFGFGLLLAFTPCVLPMVPIVAGMIGTQSKGMTPARGLALSAAYVGAMATALAAIGAAAALSGANLQLLLQAPWAILLISALFVALALASFGLFELRMPQAVTGRLSRVAPRPGSPWRAAMLGFSSALIVGPCVTAPLAGALIYIAQSGDLLLGAAALFAMGLGQGVPLLAVGLFGASVLPRMGPWMGVINRAFGLVFLAMALWLLARVLPGPLVLALWAVLLIGTGIFLGGRDRLARNAPVARRLATGLGVVALIAGGVQGVGAALGAEDPLRPLAPLTGRTTAAGSDSTLIGKENFARVETPDALRAALGAAPGQPALIYVTADWCTYCRTIEAQVFPDPAVQAGLAGRNLIVIDVTRFDSDDQALLDTLQTVGPPTLIFLDPRGAETPGTRLIGDATAADLADALARSAS